MQAYLDVETSSRWPKKKASDAIHPGYGFLSENPALPRACEKAGITFVGPSADLLEMLGDKTAARKLAERAGVPIVPGTENAIENPEEARAFAERSASRSSSKPRSAAAGAACAWWINRKSSTGRLEEARP